MGRRLDWNKHCTREFGKYIEAHSDPDITNSPKSRTFVGIYLGVTGKRQATLEPRILEPSLEPHTVDLIFAPQMHCDVLTIFNTPLHWGAHCHVHQMGNPI